MITPRYLIILMAFSLLIITCSKHSTNFEPPRELSLSEKAVVESANDFGLNLFKQVVADNPDVNLCVSPLSVAMALGMTYNGARGTTKEAMDSVLGLMGLDITEVNEAYQSVIDLLEGMDPHVTFELANSIWYRQNFPIAQNFVDLNREYFYADVTSMNFTDPGAANAINNWISNATHGRITDVIEPPIQPNTVMFLINAIYFLADWQYQFDPANTHDYDFQVLADSTVSCHMMSQENSFGCYYGSGYGVVKMPYGHGLYAMLAILPYSETDINELISQISAEDIAAWQAVNGEGEISVALPRFQMEFKTSLVDQLTAMGMGVAFGPYANLSGMVEGEPQGAGLYIDDVLHNTFIKVDEEGTEAAAVTVVIVGESAPQPFIFNRPFIFLITESNSNTILFAGKVVVPEWPEN